MASDLYHDMVVENEYGNYYDQFERSHLAYQGYIYMEGWWERIFENKVVVARKDYPAFGIKKGEKHRFIKTKYIEAETGRSSWEVEREPLNKVANEEDRDIAKEYYQ